MDLTEFYKKEVKEPDMMPAILMVSASIAQGLLLSVIIKASSSVSPDNSNFQFFWLSLIQIVTI